MNKKARTRYEQRVFVVEGPKMCFEAPPEWVQQRYVSESFLNAAGNRERLKGCEYETVSDSVLKSVSDTKTPQGILCLVRMPDYTLNDLLYGLESKAKAAGRSEPQPDKRKRHLLLLENMQNNERKPHLLLLENIQDPGNLGTMVRTGEGAGITGIIMNKGTVDLFHPKVVRATMGSLFRVPFLVTEDLRQTAAELKRKGISLYAAHLKGKKSYDQPDYTGATGFLIGNEGNGLSEETAGMADDYVKIPMEGRVESLNAAIAATLLMYEVNRQRR